MVQWADALQYAALVMNTCYTHQSQPDLQQLILRLVEQVNQRPSAMLQQSILLGSLEDMLELAMRSFSSCGASPDDLSPYILLDHISDSTPRNLAARVFSFIAHVYFETRYQTGVPGVANIDAIYRGAHMANMAAELGFISPVVLFIANTIESMGCRWRADCPYEGKHDIERFENLEDLWRAHDERKAEMASAEESREKKVQANPYHYICAGCGLEGTHRSGLQRCGGKCSKQWKPAYCSRDCQRLDWKRHKPFCRSEGAADAWAMSLQRSTPGSDSISVPDASSTLDPSYIARSYTDVASRKYERRVTTLAPDGRTIQIASSTMTPSSMRELRDVLLRDSLVL